MLNALEGFALAQQAEESLALDVEQSTRLIALLMSIVITNASYCCKELSPVLQDKESLSQCK